MHYKNGRPAKIGDRVVGKDYQGNPVCGVVVSTLAGASTCNIHIVPANPQAVYTSSEFLHIDDVLPPSNEHKS